MKPTALLSLPLIAAPALAGTPTQLPPDRDNTLFQNPDGLISNGAGERLFVGTNQGNNVRRALLHFDVAGSVPAGSTITSASLTVNVSLAPPGASPLDASLHLVSADWGEGTSDATGPEGTGAPSKPGDATWMHTFFDTSTWTSLGGDFAGAPSASTSLGTSGLATFASAQMVADVQSWLDTPGVNFGWLIKADQEGPGFGGSAKRLDSREFPNPALRPSLAIEFIAPPVGTSYCVAAANSVGPGANLSATGSEMVALNCLVLAVDGLPPNAPGLFFYGPNQVQQPFGDGFRCVGGSIQRLQPVVFADSNGEAGRLANPGDLGFSAGQTVRFQFWYRDPMGPGGSGFNLSDGLSVAFQ